MPKKFYAGKHALDRSFAYGEGWRVFVFESKLERDNFVFKCNKDDCANGNNERTEAITRDVARRIVGSDVVEKPAAEAKELVQNEGYYKVNYWGRK